MEQKECYPLGLSLAWEKGLLQVMQEPGASLGPAVREGSSCGGWLSRELVHVCSMRESRYMNGQSGTRRELTVDVVCLG